MQQNGRKKYMNIKFGGWVKFSRAGILIEWDKWTEGKTGMYNKQYYYAGIPESEIKIIRTTVVGQASNFRVGET